MIINVGWPAQRGRGYESQTSDDIRKCMDQLNPFGVYLIGIATRLVWLDFAASHDLHPGRLTWNLKNDGWKTAFLLGWYIFRGYVELLGGITSFTI